MPPTEIDLRQSAYETACRDFWYANVMIEAGDYPSATISHIKDTDRSEGFNTQRHHTCTQQMSDER
jgi:hypothetical protein